MTTQDDEEGGEAFDMKMREKGDDEDDGVQVWVILAGCVIWRKEASFDFALRFTRSSSTSSASWRTLMPRRNPPRTS